MELTYRSQTAEIERQRHRLNGLGPAAGHLRRLRDQLATETPAPGSEPG